MQLPARAGSAAAHNVHAHATPRHATPRHATPRHATPPQEAVHLPLPSKPLIHSIPIPSRSLPIAKLCSFRPASFPETFRKTFDKIAVCRTRCCCAAASPQVVRRHHEHSQSLQVVSVQLRPLKQSAVSPSPRPAPRCQGSQCAVEASQAIGSLYDWACGRQAGRKIGRRQGTERQERTQQVCGAG